MANIGHFDNEIDLVRAGARCRGQRRHVRPMVEEFSDGQAVIVLSEGRLVNLGAANGHPAA